MYEKMYYILSSAVAEAMKLLEEQKYQLALTCLEMASRDAEEIYIKQ